MPSAPLGGRGADRAGARRASAALVALIAVTVAAVTLAPPGAPLFLALGGFYLAVGRFTASSCALFMNIAVKGSGATQSTACVAMTNLGERQALVRRGIDETLARRTRA